MNNNLLKTGASSIVLGKNHYKNFIEGEFNYLLKITKKNNKHNEHKYIKYIKTIDNYKNYYSIPESANIQLSSSEKFYDYLKSILDEESKKLILNIDVDEHLICNYIEYAGNKELFDTINDLDRGDLTFWKSYKKIYMFSKFILEGLYYLHNKQICHLDIKPENIMVNTYKKKMQFKIIDFGFSSKFPFDDYVNNLRCTPGYFPQQFSEEKVTNLLPLIETNDMVIDKNLGDIPFKKIRKFVYKIDCFCFGRVLHMLKYVYKDTQVYTCFNYEKNIEKKIDNIINDLLEKDVFKRINIAECLYKHFK